MCLLLTGIVHACVCSHMCVPVYDVCAHNHVCVEGEGGGGEGGAHVIHFAWYE